MWKFVRLASKVARFPLASSSPTLVDDSSVSGHGLLETLQRLLAERRTTWTIIAVALLLTSTSLTLGLTGDDYLHKLWSQQPGGIEGVQRAGYDLFTFSSGDPREVQTFLDEGLAPWWAARDLRISFFRPLSSLTHALDYSLWPNSPVLMHLHSMLWFALLLLTVAAVQRRFSASPWVAGLAFFLYAVDDGHAAPVGWLSNRNALIATIPPLLALLAHDRRRRQNDRAAGVAAPLLFALGLASGEPSVQASGFILAYALCLDPGTWKQRLRSLLPYAAVVVVWRVIYFVGEYGVRGSSMYIDPVSDPLYFLQTLAIRLPILVLGQFALPYSEFWDLLPVIAPSLQPAMLVLAVGVTVTAVWLLLPLWRRDPLVRFWAVGTLLAMIPGCAAVPNDRLLLAAGVGGSALVARFLAAVSEHAYPRRGRVPNAAAAGLVAVHALFAPLVLPFRTKAVDGLEVLMRRADKSIPSTPDVEQRSVVLLNPPVDPIPVYFPGYREAQGIPRPRYQRWLATGVSAIDVTRVDAHTLELRPHAGYLSNSSQWMLRDRLYKSRPGETIPLADCDVVVQSVTEDARPLAVRFRFREPLESSRYEWMQWGRHEYVPFRPPRVGESTTIPAVDLRSALLGLGLTDS